jgi:hypothetical protein
LERDGRSQNVLNHHSSSVIGLSIEKVLQNFMLIFKLRNPYWCNLSELDKVFESDFQMERFVRSLSGLGSLINDSTMIADNFDSICCLLEESVSLMRTLKPKRSLDVEKFKNTLEALKDHFNPSDLQRTVVSPDCVKCRQIEIKEHDSAMDIDILGDKDVDMLESNEEMTMEVENTEIVTPQYREVHTTPRELAVESNDIPVDPENLTKFKDFLQRLEVMKLFQFKKPNAMTELWDLVNETPTLLKYVYSTDAVPVKEFSKECRSWITMMARPILRCLRNHFEDKIELFEQSFPKITASKFREICDGSEMHPHPYKR